jgi:release factor glutamine methyltransferase
MGSGLSALPPDLRGAVDLVVANLPYVPSAEVALLPREARLHEPLTALDGGADGLDPMRSAVAEAPAWLRPGGHYLGEVHMSQLAAVRDLAAEAGFSFLRELDRETSTAIVDLTAPEAAGRQRALLPPAD